MFSLRVGGRLYVARSREAACEGGAKRGAGSFTGISGPAIACAATRESL
jgi:hypothetical protein